MYAIVKAGGRQEKVAVGDTVFVDRVDAATGSTISFPARSEEHTSELQSRSDPRMPSSA